MSNNDDTVYPSIKATFVRRTLTLITARYRLCSLGSRDWRSKLPICRDFMLKHGKINTIEAHTMQFIVEKTSIPVPKIYCAFSHKGKDYVVMERVSGTALSNDWHLRTNESKAAILTQLKDMMTEMRALPVPPGNKVTNVLGGPLYDCRLCPHDAHGPFTSPRDFHNHLRRGYDGYHADATQHNELFHLHEAHAAWPVCFTHGDLSSLNILARGDRITGIVDWETAGWYPAYWEYTSAWNVNVYNIFWRKCIAGFLEPAPEELRMERLRNLLYGSDWFFVDDESYARLGPGWCE